MDLVTSTSNALVPNAEYWAINGQLNPSFSKIYDCGNNLILGNANGFTANDHIERTYTGLGSHDIIYYSIRILAINGWQSGDTITIHLDGTLVATWEPFLVMAIEGVSLCDSPAANDVHVFIVGKYYHTTSTLTLRITSHITSGSTTAAFGIRGVRMGLGYRKVNDAQSMCIKFNVQTTVAPSACTCKSGYTQDPLNPGQCIKCASSTTDCFGPNDEGYGCVPGYSFNGNKCIACVTGCEYCLRSDPNVCLLCAPAQILSWDNTCSVTCNHYLRTENGYQFCDICPPGFFSYPNGTCLSSWLVPWKERIQVTSHFCDYPCGDSSTYYYPKEAKCSPKCEYPFQVQEQIYCVLNLAEGEIEQAQTFATLLSIGSKIIKTASAIAGALSARDPRALCLATLSELLHYIRYMKIRYPLRLQLILDQEETVLFELVPEMTEEMLKALPDNPLPEKFQQYELPSCFLVNFWEPGISLVTTVALGVVLASALEIVCKKSKSLSKIFRNIKEAVKWNYLLMLFISYLEDIVLSTSFELRTFNFGSTLSTASFITCLIVNVIAFLIFVKMMTVIWALWKAKSRGARSSRSLRLDMTKKRLKNYEALFEEHKEGSVLQLAYLCFFVIKVYLFYATIAYLFDYPRIQTIIITSLSLCMLLYILITRPFKSRFSLFQNILQESLILIVNVGTMIFSLLDHTEAEAYETRRIVGEILIGCDLTFSAFGILCLFISLGTIIYGLYQRLKMRPTERKVTKAEKKATKPNGRGHINQRDVIDGHSTAIKPSKNRRLNQDRSKIRSLRNRSHVQRPQNSLYPTLPESNASIMSEPTAIEAFNTRGLARRPKVREYR